MTTNELLINFLISLVSGILGILIVLWIERQRRPKLVLTIGKKSQITENDPLGRPPATWLYVEVHNKGMPRWLSWVYNREPALSCHAWITFYHLDGHKVYDREMNVRWSETPEPMVQIIETERNQAIKKPLTATPQNLVKPQEIAVEKVRVGKLLNVQETVDIPPGEFTNIDVVFRVNGEDECYGWCNQSYLYNWRHPDWKLEKERYIVRVRVKTGGKEFTNRFRVVNDVPYNDFRLDKDDDRPVRLQ